VITDGSNITYTYFLLTDDEMYVNHYADYEWSTKIQTCTSTLYKGYAEKLSVEAAMSDCENSKVVSSASELKKATKNYVSSGILYFAVAAPQSAGVTSDMIGEAISEGIIAGGIKNVKGYSYSYRDVCSYTVYIITVTLKES